MGELAYLMLDMWIKTIRMIKHDMKCTLFHERDVFLLPKEQRIPNVNPTTRDSKISTLM